jgi:hypothetical protein
MHLRMQGTEVRGICLSDWVVPLFFLVLQDAQAHGYYSRLTGIYTTMLVQKRLYCTLSAAGIVIDLRCDD